MKLNKLAYLLVFGLALSFAATGCKKTPVGVTQLPGSKAGAVGGDNASGLPQGEKMPAPENVGTGGGALPANWTPEDMNQDRAALAAYTVHFDFDSAVVKSSEKVNIEAVAAALKLDPATRLLIEGHCDERGTEEYNRALGERRALALREALVKLGISPDRIRTISYGEDRPLDPAHNEAAWSKNRRGEFILLHPKQ